MTGSELTWNQHRALRNLAKHGPATPRECADPFEYFTPYLCGASARSALMALVRKGLAKCIPTSPLRYEATEAGRALLARAEQKTEAA